MRYASAVTPAPLLGWRRRHPRAAWLSARLRAHSLDRQLGAGVPPWQSPTLAARARQLTSERNRDTLARSLERLVELAEEPPSPYRTSVIPPCRPQVREARPLMLAMPHRLRAREPVNARGVARLNDILTDGAGPCYVPSRPDALRLELEIVDKLLDVRD
jgi:hypothetical protein